jgi:hypothetical protein
MINDADPMAKSPLETSKSATVNNFLSYHFSSRTTFPFQSILVPFDRIPDSIKVVLKPEFLLFSSYSSISISISVFPVLPPD